MAEMRIERAPDAQRFVERVLPLLMRDEAANHQLIGSILSMANHPHLYDEPLYLAACWDRDNDSLAGAAAMAPHHNVILSLMPEAAAVAVVDDLLNPDLPHFSAPGVLGANAVAQSFAERWQFKTGQSVHLTLAERIYKLERVRPVEGVSGSLRRATVEDRELLVRWMLGFRRDTTHQPEQPRDRAEQTVDRSFSDPDSEFYLWLDPEPVSLTGHTGPTPSGMEVGPVYTPPEHRNHGYAAACTAAVSQLLLDSGRSACFLFTDRDNATSNHIYPTIGYEPVIDFAQYTIAGE